MIDNGEDSPVIEKSFPISRICFTVFNFELLLHQIKRNTMDHRYSILRFFSISVLILFTSFFSVSQHDFNNYQTLLSKGEMPTDFSTPISQKILSDQKNSKLIFKTDPEAYNYFKTIHENMNEILYSGFVVYGDDVSVYVQRLASNMLKDEPELLSSLRFYVIKSNEINAFSTAPGIIFVTTGLISQLSSEAQLAFILSHEIAHYELNHVHEGYVNRQKNADLGTKEQITAFSQFSKENELDADKLALKRYNKSGYSTEELIGTFDVLMYSYLPFDEIPFPKNYFNKGNLYLPLESLNVYSIPITAEEDYDDKLSTHPNIKKRKEAVLKGTTEFNDWGSLSFTMDENEFRNIRTICRFESVRTNVIEGNNFSALYDIFLLERSYPESLFLDRMKALSWLSIIRLNEHFEKNPSIVEGESSLLYHFLVSCTHFDRSALGLRIIYDLKQKYPQDFFFETAYYNCIDEVSKYDLLNPLNFKTVNFQTASHQQESSSLSSLTNNEDSKYDRIKTKRAATKLTGFDITEYLKYSIPDIIQDSNFLFTYRTLKKQNDSIFDSQKQFQSLSYNDQRTILNQRIKQALTIEPSNKKIIFIEPGIEIVSKKPTLEIGLITMEKNYINQILMNAKSQGFDPIVINQEAVIGKSTDEFNEYNIYLNYLEQSGRANKGKNVLSTNPELLNNYYSKRSTSHLLFTRVIDHSYFKENMPSGSLVSYSAPYSYFVYSPRYIFNNKSLYLFSIVLDLKTGKTFSYEQGEIYKKLAPASYKSHYEDLFKLIRAF